ncbi:hypothetical protein B296_00013303 [Ensete ventricosum]|uniref:Uncharacterized protein n=1 Tax=Ensete ventricosum TaxID=4639 RepID=A0A426XRZ6_ENSVE|nr:hypothetical protein B296_00013303 [Ensete ventricosum]
MLPLRFLNNEDVSQPPQSIPRDPSRMRQIDKHLPVAPPFTIKEIKREREGRKGPRTASPAPVAAPLLPPLLLSPANAASAAAPSPLLLPPASVASAAAPSSLLLTTGQRLLCCCPISPALAAGQRCLCCCPISLCQSPPNPCDISEPIADTPVARNHRDPTATALTPAILVAAAFSAASSSVGHCSSSPPLYRRRPSLPSPTAAAATHCRSLLLTAACSPRSHTPTRSPPLPCFSPSSLLLTCRRCHPSWATACHSSPLPLLPRYLLCFAAAAHSFFFPVDAQ